MGLIKIGAHVEVDQDRLADICRRYGIAELAIFGSVIRDDFGPESDIDLLYVFQPNTHIGWDIVDLEEELQLLFGRRVDLVPKKWLRPRLAEEVLPSAQTIFDAHAA